MNDDISFLSALDDDILLVFENSYRGQVAALDRQIKALSDQKQAIVRILAAIIKKQKKHLNNRDLT